MTACTRVSVLAALVSQSLVARAGVPVCNHDTMADNAFCFPPEYNKVTDITSCTRVCFDLGVSAERDGWSKVRS